MIVFSLFFVLVSLSFLKLELGNDDSDLECRVVVLRDIIQYHLQFLADAKVIKFEELKEEENYVIAVVDWCDGATASQKNFLLLTCGFIHNDEIFNIDQFSKLVVEFRFPIIILKGKENEKNVEVTQEILASLYESLNEPFEIKGEEKVLHFYIKPAGGKSDHKDLWMRIGNKVGGKTRCGGCDISEDDWESYSSVINASTKGFFLLFEKKNSKKKKIQKKITFCQVLVKY